MAEITKELGRIPVTRGEYEASITYYKDNIVQYKRGSYQVVSESPIIGVPPTNDKNVVNPGWTLFAGTLDAQDVVNQIKEQEAQSIQAVAAREAEILSKSDAAKVSFDNTGTSLSGTNVQGALEETDGKINQLKNAGYLYAGIATPTTNPGTPDGPVFYLATESGTYSNFGVTLQDEIAAIVYNNGNWKKQSIVNIAKNTGYFDDKVISQRAMSKKIDDLSVAIGVTEITLTADDFSDMIYSLGEKIIKSNVNYNSFIIRVPSSARVSYDTTYLSTQLLFNEAPILNKSYTKQSFKSGNIIPDGYSYLLINIDLQKYDNSPFVITIQDDKPKVEMSYEYGEFNKGFIHPITGNMTVVDNENVVHFLKECTEGQRFIVSAKIDGIIYAWQFLDSNNNIITKYEGGTTPLFNDTIVAPAGAKKILVNSINTYNYSVKYFVSNYTENILSQEIDNLSTNLMTIDEEVIKYDKRITDTENAVEDVKVIVGSSENTISLVSADYSGFVYTGTQFIASSTYNAFIFPLYAGVKTQLINNTELSNGDAGLSTVWTFDTAPALGEMKYVRKGGVDFKWGLFEPLDNEKYICININTSIFSDNNFSFKTDSYGLFKKIDNLENSSNALKGKTILCLGDSITELMYNNKRYSDYIAEITQANVINGGIGGTQMGRRIPLPSDLTFKDNSQAYAALDLPSIANALHTGDFTLQEAAAQWLISDENPNKQNDDNNEIIEILKNVNLSNVDIVTIFIGTNDYNGNLGEIGEIGDDTSSLNMAQGFHQIIKHLLTANPNLRIYYFSPMPRYFSDVRTFDPNNASEDSNWCDNVVGVKGFKFPDMVDHQIKLAQYYKIPVCDMYRTMGINQWNIASIMRGDISDGTHPYKGLKMLANKIVSFINATNNLNV